MQNLHYAILTADTAHDLQVKVNKCLADNYRLVGGLVVTSGSVDGMPWTEYAQAMLAGAVNAD